MKTYTSRDIADGIIAKKITRETTFVLESETKERLQRFRDTLDLLVSVQNGCPLSKYELDWNTAMSDAKELLKEYYNG